MNKRITSLMLVFTLILTMLATAVSALAAPTVSTCTYSIEADKTSANPGDTINFTIYMQQTGTMNSMEGTLIVPEGLTFVANSGKVKEGVSTTLNWYQALEGVAWTPWSFEPTEAGLLNGFGAISYTGTDKLALMEFQCTVDIDAPVKDYEVKLIELVADDENYDTKNPTCIPAIVTVTAAPKPATGISLNKGSATIYTGNSETLYATVTPDDSTDTVVWESSQTSVATVDNTGKVTAVAPGTAVITAKAGSKTATCTITVENAPCTHDNKTPISAQESTCKDRGWDAYKKCDDCDQLFDTEDNTISAIPFRTLAAHTEGTPATCKNKAVCSVCMLSYGDYAAHNYTAETKKAETLKTAGTCKDKAVYWYSCSVCGNVENNNSHTFEGDKVATNHAGGTYLKNQKETNCKEEGYTGDTYCADCDTKIEDGRTIDKSAHNPASVWSHNNSKHWKECSNVVGCGVKLNEDVHTSTGENVATCQHKAVCDVCAVQYGELASHNYSPIWSKDTTSHWHACTGCDDKKDIKAHTPNHTGHATEEYAIKCTECDYVIEAQLKHTHVFDKEVATDAYKSTGATCTTKATYFKSCSCGEKGTKTFEYGELTPHNWNSATCTAPKTCTACGATEGDALDHTEGTEWKSDADNHWHICTVAGCGVVIESSKAAHTPDRAVATETEPVKCSECSYIITPALGTPTEPTEPTDSTTPEKPDDKPQTPQTGDNSHMALWFALLFVSGAGVVGTTVFSRKRSTK